MVNLQSPPPTIPSTPAPPKFPFCSRHKGLRGILPGEEMAFSLPFPTPPPNKTGVSEEASAEGLISRSLFTTEKSAWLSPNGPSPPLAPAAAHSPAAWAGPWGSCPGKQGCGRPGRACGTRQGPGEYIGTVEGPWRPERGSLSPGIIWEPPIGEASVSLFCLYFVRLCPSGWQHWCVWGGIRGTQVAFVPSQKKTVSEEGYSGQCRFTWDIGGAPSHRRGGSGPR